MITKKDKREMGQENEEGSSSEEDHNRDVAVDVEPASSRKEQAKLFLAKLAPRLKELIINYKHVLIVCTYLFIHGAGQAASMPVMPGVKRRYFGSDQRAAMVQSSIDCSAAALGLLTAPIIGRLMDTWGRYPFFLIYAVVQLIPFLLLLFWPHQILTFMIVKGVFKIFQQGHIYAYISDNVEVKYRGHAFAATQALSYVCGSFGMVLNGLTNDQVIIFTAASQGATVLFAGLFMSESLPRELRKPWSTFLTSVENPIASMAPLLKSRASIITVGILSFYLIAQVGTTEVYIYYLNLRIGFDRHDNANLFLEEAIMQPLMLLTIYPLLCRYLSRVLMIMSCLVALMLQFVVCVTIWAKWPVFAILTPLDSYNVMIMPTLLAILSNVGDATDQGRRMAGITAVMDVCKAVGPLIFGQIFAHMHGAWVVLPFAISGALSIPAAALSLFIERSIAYDAKTKEKERSASTMSAAKESERLLLNSTEEAHSEREN